jgi:hypothetical protein
MRTGRRPAELSPLAAAPTFVIVSTAYVVPPEKWNRAPYVEIVLGYDHTADSPRQIFATRDETIIERALAAECTERRFTADAGGMLEGTRHAYRLILALTPVGNLFARAAS